MEKTKRVGRDLTSGPVLQTMIPFAIPMILAQLLQQLYSAVDLMIIGKFVGKVGTVAVSTGSELIDFMTIFSMAIAMGSQVYLAQLAGAKDEKNLKEAVGTLFTLLLGMSVLIMVAILLLHKPILTMLKCPAEAYDQAAEYMMIAAVGMPFIYGYNGIASMLRAMGESRRPMIFIAVAATVNIFADLFFVAVLHMEAAGTAIATVLSQIGSFTAAFIYLYKHKETFGFKLELSYFKINPAALRRILVMAVPQLVRTFAVQSSMLWVKAHINDYGLVVSSTYSIGNKVEKLLQVFVMGLDGAAGSMMGQSIGARNHDRVYKIMWTALLCSGVVAVVIAGLFLTIPDALYSLFTNDAEVIEMGRTFLKIMSLGILIMAAANCFKGIATGAGAALLSLLIGVLDGVSRILACLVFYYVFHQGAVSYFWGAAFCMLIPGVISAVYFFSGKWKTKKLLSER